jgi:hypothetical protein
MDGSRFGAVRDYFGDERVLKERLPKKERTRFLLADTGDEYDATTWTVATKEDGSGGSYQIQRSRSVPFDYTHATIVSPNKMSFTARVRSFSPESQADMPTPLPFDPNRKSDLVKAAEKTKQRVAESRAEQPNWELWRYESKGQPVRRLFAEFASSNKDRVVLRNKGQPLVLMVTDFPEAADREVLARGRKWFGDDDKLFFQARLMHYDAIKREAYFELTDKSRRPVPLSELSKRDQQLVVDLGSQ